VVTVAHAGGSYPVIIEPGVLDRLPELAVRHLAGRRTALITDETVGNLYARYLAGASPAWQSRPRTCSDTSPAGWRERFAFPAGEQSKTRDTWAALTDRLLAAGFGRGSAIVALGGGVVGDLAGFVAATLGRGVPWMQVPTTLLAMVDASVGGKTGVNTAAGKNLVGAFHPPTAVVADPLTLSTLPETDFRGGLAEAVKHGLIADAGYLEWLLGHATEIAARDAVLLSELVRRSVAIKSRIVSADEREAGERAVLNAGHTVAHALEAATGYAIPHGDAVALGLVAEAALAERLGIAERGLAETVRAALERFGLPTRLAEPVPAGGIVAAMATDKKGDALVPRFALIAAPGRPHRAESRWTAAAPEPEIVAALSRIGIE
jgi:3-dehydroquinate synthase